jgi:hypothetical protein
LRLRGVRKRHLRDFTQVRKVKRLSTPLLYIATLNQIEDERPFGRFEAAPEPSLSVYLTAISNHNPDLLAV